MKKKEPDPVIVIKADCCGGKEHLGSLHTLRLVEGFQSLKMML